VWVLLALAVSELALVVEAEVMGSPGGQRTPEPSGEKGAQGMDNSAKSAGADDG
jgi:hypothetical protein